MTPMTISIQGTWGTGKTSVMKMIHHKIDPSSRLGDNNVDSDASCKCVYFNTWEFSQFNLGNNIPIIMLQQLTNTLTGKDKSIGDAFGKLVDLGLKIGAGYLSGGADIGIDKVFKREDLEQLRELKNEFQLLINKKLGLTDKSYKLKKKTREDRIELEKTDPEGHKRIVFFIDDLDRLSPERAVELMEVLKNFLDCKNCIFVLAIDYDVVCRGVAGKYNFDPDNPRNSKKGKDFFDKIIQVPFKMPVEQYNITAYIRTLLGSVRINGKAIVGEDDDYVQNEEFVKASIGTNPRAIKRLVNSFQLISMVVSYNDEIDIAQSKPLLFATLCLQELDLNLYRAIAQKKNNLQSQDILCLRDGDTEVVEQAYRGLKTEKLDVERISRFFSLLVDILDKDNNNQLAEEELEAFAGILRIAAVTGNDAPEVEIRKGTSVSKSRIEELTKTVNYEACGRIEDMIRTEGGIEPILRDRANEVSIVASFGREDKLKIEFNENSNGRAFTVWCEARATFFENIPESI